MAAKSHPRRSVLYMPGSNARALEKGRSLPADALILDLEDSVSPDAKSGARDQVIAAVKAGGYGPRELLIRINGIQSAWGRDDIAAAATSGADAILVPKVESAAMVTEVETAMQAAGAPADMTIWCMMETPMGILRAAEIAGASPRLGGLVMGTSDLAKDLHCNHTRERSEMITSLGLCLLAARAFGLCALDGVYLDLADDEGFAHSCAQGRDLGFDGKTLIHPKTIDVANAAFAPSSGDIAWSRKIIAAHADAEAAGKGVVLVDGKLIENLHVEAAHRLVDMAEAIAGIESEAIAGIESGSRS